MARVSYTCESCGVRVTLKEVDEGGAFFDGEPVRHVIQKVVPLEGAGKVLVNAGSVGQPRDANPEASFAVLDVEKREIVFKRTDYDIDATAKKILDAGLPASLAERLFLGY